MDTFTILAATACAPETLHLTPGQGYPSAMAAYAAMLEHCSAGLLDIKTGRMLDDSAAFYHQGYAVDYPRKPAQFVQVAGHAQGVRLHYVDVREAGPGFIYQTAGSQVWHAAMAPDDLGEMLGPEYADSLQWFLRQWFT